MNMQDHGQGNFGGGEAKAGAVKSGGMGRGSFLKFLSAAPLIGMVASAKASDKPAAAEKPADPAPAKAGKVKFKKGTGKKRAKWGMAIDLDTCTGCGSCVVSCKVENNVPFTHDDPNLYGTQISWMTMLPMGTNGSTQLTPTPCMHCENPPCVKVCPVNATFQNDEGIVDQIWDRCIGCRYCMNACPYSRRYFNWTAPEFPETHQQALNPDVATRSHGVVEKCTFCVHRVRNLRENCAAEERDITDEDVQMLPACAQSCPADSIIFGDLNDPESLLSRLAHSPRAHRLLEHVGTKPKVYFLGKDKKIGNGTGKKET